MDSQKMRYTEDDIPINTICLSFPKIFAHFWDQERINLEFQRFGEINKIQFASSENEMRILVHFKNCRDASRALEMTNIQFLEIEAANSWEQDNYEPLNFFCDFKVKMIPARNNSVYVSWYDDYKTAVQNFSLEEDEDDNCFTIMNPYCWKELILRMDIVEQFKMKKVSRNFVDLVDEAMREIKDFDFTIFVEKYGRLVTLMLMRYVLKIIGRSLRSLVIQKTTFYVLNVPFYRYIQLIPLHCPNLKELELEGFVVSEKIFDILRRYLTNLNWLILINCPIEDKIVQLIRDRVNLKIRKTVFRDCYRSMDKQNLEFVYRKV